jgi:hypothetical protein
MKKQIVWAFGLVALLEACGEDEKIGGGKLSLKDGASLGMAVSCSVTELTCPDNGICAVVNLAEGAIGPICVAPQICDELECDVGGCFIAESAPAQVFCKN